MSSTTHIVEANLSQTKGFEFVLVTDLPPLSFCARYQRTEQAQAVARPQATPAVSSLREFHEEFKRLVLASDAAVSADLVTVW